MDMTRTTGINDPSTPGIWDDKHPKAPITYRGRPLPGPKSLLNGLSGKANEQWDIDVRNFIWGPDDSAFARLFNGPVPTSVDEARDLVKAGDIDGAAWAIQRFVCHVLTYTGDTGLGSPEFWLFPGESIALRKGDCEDGAILTVSLCRFIGIPAFRIRVAAGMVNPGKGAAEGGHAWASYLRDDQTWVALDWCYYADPDIPMADKIPLFGRPEYFDGNRVWFSFNDVNAWSHEGNVQIRGRIATGE